MRIANEIVRFLAQFKCESNSEVWVAELFCKTLIGYLTKSSDWRSWRKPTGSRAKPQSQQARKRERESVRVGESVAVQSKLFTQTISCRFT